MLKSCLVFLFAAAFCVSCHIKQEKNSAKVNEAAEKLSDRKKSPAEMSWDERREFYAEMLKKIDCGIDPSKSIDGIIDGLSNCVTEIKTKLTPEILSQYPDEPFILATVEEAISAVRTKPREFGIGAVLVNGSEIIERAHNSQLTTKRSDLHAEMTMMNKYEDRTTDQRLNHRYPANLRLYSSTEPCPMCYTRIVIAGVPSYWGASSEFDGMAHIRDNLPSSWAANARKIPSAPAKSSPRLNAIAEALFYSYIRFEIYENLH